MERRGFTVAVKRQWKRLAAGVAIVAVMVTSTPMTGVYAGINEILSNEKGNPVSYQFHSVFTNEEETEKEITLEACADSGYRIESIQVPDGKIWGGYRNLYRK